MRYVVLDVLRTFCVPPFSFSSKRAVGGDLLYVFVFFVIFVDVVVVVVVFVWVRF